jgi:hypothetical protein
MAWASHQSTPHAARPSLCVLEVDGVHFPGRSRRKLQRQRRNNTHRVRIYGRRGAESRAWTPHPRDRPGRFSQGLDAGRARCCNKKVASSYVAQGQPRAARRGAATRRNQCCLSLSQKVNHHAPRTTPNHAVFILALGSPAWPFLLTLHGLCMDSESSTTQYVDIHPKSAGKHSSKTVARKSHPRTPLCTAVDSLNSRRDARLVFVQPPTAPEICAATSWLHVGGSDNVDN